MIRLTILSRPNRKPSRYSKQQLANRVDGIVLVARIMVITGQSVSPVVIGNNNNARRRRSLVDTGSTFLFMNI